MVSPLLSWTQLNWTVSLFSFQHFIQFIIQKSCGEKSLCSNGTCNQLRVIYNVNWKFFFSLCFFLHLFSHSFHSFCHCMAMGSMARNHWLYWTIIIIIFQNMILQFDGYKFQIQSNYVPRNNPIKDTHR